jgi:hypothetical protein
MPRGSFTVFDISIIVSLAFSGKGLGISDLYEPIFSLLVKVVLPKFSARTPSVSCDDESAMAILLPKARSAFVKRINKYLSNNNKLNVLHIRRLKDIGRDEIKPIKYIFLHFFIFQFNYRYI